VDAVFCPAISEIYPPGFATTVTVGGLDDILEGAFRPGHFQGVATVVAKLLLQTGADMALFGEKDYQQLQVIKRLVSDLNIPVDIIGIPTVRDAAGLALSSRNAYLDENARIIATSLSKILFTIRDRIMAGVPWKKALQDGQAALLSCGFDAIDYLDVRDESHLTVPAADRKTDLRILAAVRIGQTRLIDNVGVKTV
jgi:pantoate--beta-alanine ligase